MLVGKRWSDFKSPKAYKYNRVLNVGEVFFTLRITKFLLRPVLRVTANGQLVVLQRIDQGTFGDLTAALRVDQANWVLETKHLGYIRAEDNEPVEAAQDVA